MNPQDVKTVAWALIDDAIEYAGPICGGDAFGCRYCYAHVIGIGKTVNDLVHNDGCPVKVAMKLYLEAEECLKQEQT